MARKGALCSDLAGMALGFESDRLAVPITLSSKGMLRWEGKRERGEEIEEEKAM